MVHSVYIVTRRAFIYFYKLIKKVGAFRHFLILIFFLLSFVDFFVQCPHHTCVCLRCTQNGICDFWSRANIHTDYYFLTIHLHIAYLRSTCMLFYFKHYINFPNDRVEVFYSLIFIFVFCLIWFLAKMIYIHFKSVYLGCRHMIVDYFNHWIAPNHLLNCKWALNKKKKKN